MDNKNNKDWRFCVVGNIVKTHLDEEGVIRYGTKAFTGGTKVYIPWKWDRIDDRDGALVIGMNRFHRYALEYVPFELLENIRFQIVFKKAVLRIIGRESIYGVYSWGRTADDKRGAKACAEKLAKHIEVIKTGPCVQPVVKDEIDELFERRVRVILPSNYDSKKENIGAAIGIIAFFVLMILFV